MNPLSFGLIFRFVARFSLLLRSVIIRLLVIIAFRFLSVSVIPDYHDCFPADNYIK